MPQEYDEVAGVYARSLYELAHEAGGLDKAEEVYAELDAIVEMSRADPRLREFLSSPILGKGAREQALRSAFENRVSDMLLRFLLVANDKGRLGELSNIASALDAMLQKAHGRIEVDVYTASADQIGEELLEGVVEKIRVPFLVTHGERDSQIPLKWAQRTYEQLVNSPKRELKIFTDREGGAQHASFDNSINAGHYIADWVAETLGGRTAAASGR